MEGVQLVHLPAVHVHGIPAQQELLFVLPPAGHGLHGNESRKLQNAVGVNVLRVHIIVQHRPNAGIRLRGVGDIGKMPVFHHEHIGYDGIVPRRTGHKHRRGFVLKNSRHDAADAGGVLRKLRLHRPDDLTVLIAVQHRHAPLGFLLAGAQNHEFASAAA